MTAVVPATHRKAAHGDDARFLSVDPNPLRTPGVLPIWSLVALPLVPLISGYPLRAVAAPRGFYAVIFQIFSSFTTIARHTTLALLLTSVLPLAAFGCPIRTRPRQSTRGARGAPRMQPGSVGW